MEEPLRKSGDPFADEPLPKAYYFPSMQKDLNSNERKTCLSPTKSKDAPLMSPEDERFLKETNLVQEIPTRENGTMGDDCSSSKFDESWPSTEQTTPSSITSPLTDSAMNQDLFDTQENQAPLWMPPPDSTLAKYIHRFRYSKPCSRSERDGVQTRSGHGGEFWWLSPPGGSSTPKDSTPPVKSSASSLSTPSDRPLPQVRPSTSPKRPNTGNPRGRMSPTSPPRSKKTTSETSSSLDILVDQRTKELQNRAKTLLEKSESTLNWTSSSAPGQNICSGSRQTKPGLRTVNSSFRQTDPPIPRPAPEEDILYQWRLARRMEKAKNYTVIGKEQEHTSRVIHLQSAKPQGAQTSPVTSQYGASFTCNNINQSSCTNQDRKTGESVDEVRPPQVLRTSSYSSENLPPHAHLSCDIIPCLHHKLSKSCQNEVLPFSQAVHTQNHQVNAIHRKQSTDPVKENSTDEERTQALGKSCRKGKLHKSRETSIQAAEKLEPKTKAKKERRGKVQDGKISVADKENQFSIHTPPQKEKNATRSLDGMIGLAVSEHLFSTPISSSKSSEFGEESLVEVPPPLNLEVPWCDSSEEEFPDDIMLQDLRHKARECQEKLRHMDILLSQLPP